MSNEPNKKTKVRNGLQDDERDGGDPSRVSFFDPKGGDLGSRFLQSTQAKKPAAKPQKKTTAKQAAKTAENSALNKRVAKQSAQSIQKHAEELGEKLHSNFLRFLKKKAAEGTAPLTESDIETMSQEFQAELSTIETVFEKAIDDYTRAREKARHEQSRANHFHRLIVHNFEHRFANETELSEQPELLSRRMLPGFFSMLQLMLGEQQLVQFERDAKRIVDRLVDQNDGKIDWPKVYRSPEARKLCFQAEVQIAKHFAETEKRLNWMVAMINANLVPYNGNPQTGGWTMTTQAAELMLSDLIRNLRAALANDNARAKMDKKFGRETVSFLDAIARRFDRSL